VLVSGHLHEYSASGLHGKLFICFNNKDRGDQCISAALSEQEFIGQNTFTFNKKYIKMSISQAQSPCCTSAHPP
jgi:hypothetical protein